MRRLIDTIIKDDCTAKVYRDAEWDEYRVKFFVDGVHQVDADYHCVDRADAVETAAAMIYQGWRLA